MNILADFGASQCGECGRMIPIEEPCSVCHPRSAPMDLRCPGLGCPLAPTCSRFTNPATASNSTRWTEPPYDILTNICEDYQQRTE